MQIRIALAVCSLLLVALVVGVAFRTTTEEWHKHQQQYYDLAAKRTKDPKVRKAIREAKLEIKQDILTGYGQRRVDRCRTCHAAIDDPAFVSDKHPLRTHPKMHPHPFPEFGCTVCHEGNGRGLTKHDAHGADKHWTEPLLKKPYLESSCARCHGEPYLKETPHLARGHKLFETYACVGCHMIQNLSRGKLGAELTDVGNRLKLEAIHAKLKNPKADVALSIMPTFPLPKQDRVDLVVFLKSRRGRAIIEDPITYRRKTKKFNAMTPARIAETAAEGKLAFERRSCVACHKLGAADGKLAPELTWIGKLRDAAYFAAHLKDPRDHTPGSNMPAFWMSGSEHRAIAAFLGQQQSVTVPAQPREQYELLCARCHGEQGDGKGLIAHNLVPRPRLFNNVKFFNWLPETRAHDAILNSVPGTAMPTFKPLLARPQAEALFAWVRQSFIKTARPTRTLKRAIETAGHGYDAAAVKRGQRAFLERCYGCHGRLGDGRGPNAPDMLPRPRNLRNHFFFAKLPDSRLYESITYGIVGTGMPAWDTLPKRQRWDLIYFVRALSKTGPAAKQPTPSTTQKGGQ